MSDRGNVPTTHAAMIAACASTLSEALDITGAFRE
jgi:hypothetical protein